jgi:two-component system response regulator HydG
MFLDLRMPEMDGLELLKRVREIDEGLSVIIMTAYVTVDSAVKAMKLGAEDYLLKPLEPEVINLAIIRTMTHRLLRLEHRLLRERMASLGHAKGIIGRSKAMEDLLALAAKVAPLRSTILIQGESGTGKELLARALHEGSPRADRPFVAINCGVIPPTLLESELFGHERGAFTGAETRRVGYFEAAAGGTIFLDEISETPLDLQVKLLRVLQERVFRRVGGSAELSTDARIIVSTNRNLEEEVRIGRFRQDLFYRLNVIMLHVPPLRERLDDVSLLAHHFLGRYSEEFGKNVRGITTTAMERLLGYTWPGNVRELENTIERAVALADGTEIGVEDLTALTSNRASIAPAETPQGGTVAAYASAREDFERAYMKALLRASHGNMTEASRIAGIARQNLYQRLKKLNLDGSETLD